MSDSLRDQLLKAGLGKRPANPSKPVPQPHSKPKATQRMARAGDIDLARAYTLRAKHENEERVRAQRVAEHIAREKKERKQKLAALLAGKALNAGDAEVPRHFPHGNKIRRIYCTLEQLTRLNAGELAVVQLAGRYLLVERGIALLAQATLPEALALLCDPDAPAEDDVPADLVW
ncbi:MAG: DUF2058 family protein [Rudaea sp.]